MKQSTIAVQQERPLSITMHPSSDGLVSHAPKNRPRANVLLVSTELFKVLSEQSGVKSMSRLGLVVAALGGIVFSAPAMAADYSVPRVQHAYVARQANPYCGPYCGCPVVRFVRHREMRMGYPSSFDPRTAGEPPYFYGPVRTYARFGRFAE